MEKIEMTFCKRVAGTYEPNEEYELVTKTYIVDSIFDAFELAVKDGANPNKMVRWR